MAIDDVKLYGEAHRDQPSATTENATVPLRTTRRGELTTVALTGGKMHALANQGSYFLIRNATPGTGIAGHAAPTTVDDTKPLIYLRNDYTVAEDKRIFVDFIKLRVTAAGAGATDIRLAVKLDTATARYSSGGTAITAVNPNMESSATLSATCYAGAVVASAASASARLLGHNLIRTVVPVVGDTYIINFGADKQDANSLAVAGTAIANIVWNTTPVVIGPTSQFLLHQAGTSQSGAHSYEIEMGVWVA